ncbi:hypothetical protein [Stenotrophomonas indicatrix]|uniref:hypothetical protein n=1 Tax=Stenotrophomonas indicatrix TaxID=2045451 RepID=UPI0028ACCE56|nr:hypothetical protein [Stenotrophomonas indicatrix]
MLTMFKRLASLVPTPAASKVTLFVSDTGIPSYKDDAGLITPMSGQPIPAGYIDGLKMEYVAPGQIRFTSGSAFIPSLGRALALPSALTKTLTLSANTWYHNFLYSNSGVADVETVTTLPDTPYSGTARAKSGDTSRRYIGSFRTDSSGAIFNFSMCGNQINYRTNGGASPFRVLDNGTSTADTPISLAAVVPLTSTQAQLFFQNQSSNGFVRVSAPGDAVVHFYVPPVFKYYLNMYTDNNQAIRYGFDVAPSGGGAYVDVFSYNFER